ncbi:MULTISPECIES: MarR family winged helix-turn-helix transcriptional regulator [unclassified Rhodococcus (in: high G+C Gram-positive bacteria)]|uniref:MarR family winged helix-turn-helix transcriptional regulator n=1 Tax=unclassified Rhodococcus (in: high G+C Gram-positive bacteria) TaxID=192944 RepID=UPI00163AEDE6|nr:MULTISPECIES: MarR family transcriptional regulator [unclassified Rhodococcus (in: high G+C Gram-positive bacteria)]MBC2642149.1 MarR family transcriptional regulator [Rhodococcus sp. 3A]MBC2893109.1 MarR family transcriptional regulator [Rhodococcus sp. 4CII]
MASEPPAPADDDRGDVVDWMRTEWAGSQDSAELEFATTMALLRTHQWVVRAMDQELRSLRLSRNAYLILTSLQLSEDHTRTLGKLSKYLMVHPTTVSMAVDQLVKAGLVERRAHTTDRRTVLATLTPAGVDVVEDANARLAGVRFGLASVDTETLESLVEQLQLVRRAVGDVETGH